MLQIFKIPDILSNVRYFNLHYLQAGLREMILPQSEHLATVQ